MYVCMCVVLMGSLYENTGGRPPFIVLFDLEVHMCVIRTRLPLPTSPLTSALP